MARSNDVQCRTSWRINTMTRTSRFGRASLYAAAAAGLLGFLAGGATWARPAAAQHAAARAAAAPAHVAAARAAAQPLTAANEKNTAADRPWGLTLITPDDPIAGISAVELVHFPDNAPILFVNRTGIPAVTLNEIKRLQPVGIARDNNVQAFLVGAAAN